MDIKGTSQGTFQLGKGGPRISRSGNFVYARNAGDTAFADFFAESLYANGEFIVINQDATESGSDYKVVITRPASGMSANVTLTLPPNAGTSGYVLQTDGTGVLSWVAQSTPPSITSKITVDTTTLAFGASSPVSMFTLPANAVVHRVQVIVDTAFNGTPSLQIGISGQTDKYMATTEVDLTSGNGDRWESNPNHAAVGSTEAIIATYSAGGASIGSARLLVEYSIPE